MSYTNRRIVRQNDGREPMQPQYVYTYAPIVVSAGALILLSVFFLINASPLFGGLIVVIAASALLIWWFSTPYRATKYTPTMGIYWIFVAWFTYSVIFFDRYLIPDTWIVYGGIVTAAAGVFSFTDFCIDTLGRTRVAALVYVLLFIWPHDENNALASDMDFVALRLVLVFLAYWYFEMYIFSNLIAKLDEATSEDDRYFVYTHQRMLVIVRTAWIPFCSDYGLIVVFGGLLVRVVYDVIYFMRTTASERTRMHNTERERHLEEQRPLRDQDRPAQTPPPPAPAPAPRPQPQPQTPPPQPKPKPTPKPQQQRPPAVDFAAMRAHARELQKQKR